MNQNESALPIGSRLQEYEIESVLGVGGFGITYLAKDLDLHKKVVIKEFLPSDIAMRKESATVVAKSHDDGENFKWGLERFLKEAQTLAKFNHPNIVKVGRFIRANHTAYFVMDFEEGQDLEKYLKSHDGRLSEEEIYNIIMPILDGLREVHSHDFLHRDIKPANIYLRESGSPMLIDFGASRFAMGAKSKSLSVVLTEGYAPKEQYSSKSTQGAYTDIYAIGAVMYKMAIGKVPTESSQRADSITEDDYDPYKRLQDMRDIPYSDDFKKAVDWSLGFRTKDRPQSVRELQDALMGRAEGKNQTGNSDTTINTTKIEKPNKPNTKTKVQKPKNQKNPSSPIVPLLIVVIIALLAGGGWYISTQSTPVGLALPNNTQEPTSNSTEVTEDTKEAKRITQAKIAKQREAKEEAERIAKQKAQEAKDEAERIAKIKENLGKSIDKGDYIKPALIHIPAGSYTMGSNDGEKDEKPPRQVTINYDFEIGKYEVSVGEFKKFVNDTNYKTDAQKGDGCFVYADGSWNQKSDVNWKNAYITQDDKHPVVCVSWNDAQAYTQWLSQKTGQNYRLPTEAEWEYIARAGTTSKWSFGDDENQLTNYAWYSKNSDSKTHPIGTKNPNPWGLYDIHGNVWEWCEDWYTDNYKNSPKDGSANTKGEKDYRVLRGGSWFNVSNNTSSAYRNRINPTDSDNNVGFRLQRTLP